MAREVAEEVAFPRGEGSTILLVKVYKIGLAEGVALLEKPFTRAAV